VQAGGFATEPDSRGGHLVSAEGRQGCSMTLVYYPANLQRGPAGPHNIPLGFNDASHFVKHFVRMRNNQGAISRDGSSQDAKCSNFFE
jgi:hypothetical protein